ALIGGALQPAAVSVPFDSFIDLSQKDLQLVKLRLSYLGPSSGLLPDLTFVAEEIHHEEIRGDLSRIIPLPTVLLKQLLEALRKPLGLSLSPTAPKPYPFLFVGVKTLDPNHPKSFQASFSQDRAKEIFSIFRQTLQSHRLARYHLQGWGCAVDLLPAGQ